MRIGRGIRRAAAVVARTVLLLVGVVLVLTGLVILALETGWAKNLLRAFIVREANQYLTATLEIDRLQGSLLRGIQLSGVRLSRAGHTLVAVDDVSLSYSIRELLQHHTVIKRIRLVRPQIVMTRTPSGRWDLTEVVKREAQQEKRTGPGRPIQIDAIEVEYGSVMLNNPLDFGAVHTPTRYQALDVHAAFSYEPVSWRLTFASASWTGHDPELSARRLSGAIANGSGGVVFDNLAVETARSSFTVTGRIRRDDVPAELDLRIHATRFAFREWAGILHGLENLAIDAAFDTKLEGPLRKLATDLNMRSNGGSITGRLTLDTTVPGWHGAGQLSVARLDLARWLNRPDRPSDITGRIAFDLALELGRHFPRGSYAFAGPHVEFMHYAADDLRAHGTVTAVEALIAGATARAYGAGVAVTDGAIGIDHPFSFRFRGTMNGLDLRAVPASVPVPHVESRLAFDYDVRGQFSDAFIAGRAEFAQSELTGAILEPGTIGTIDTSATPITYTGDGGLQTVDLHRFAAGFGIEWLQDGRYAGTVAGRFRLSGCGTDKDSVVLDAAGTISRAHLFGGILTNADVTLNIAEGTLRSSYDGSFEQIDPTIPFADPRFAATLTGTAALRVSVRDLLTRTAQLDDYDVEGSVALAASTLRDMAVDRVQIEGTFRDGVARLTHAEVASPALDGHGSGTLSFTPDVESDFQYELARVDLESLKPQTGLAVTGEASGNGTVTGPATAVRVTGDATVHNLTAPRLNASTATVHYDAGLPSSSRPQMDVRVNTRASLVTVLGRQLDTLQGAFTLEERRLGFDVTGERGGQPAGSINGAAVIDRSARTVQVEDLEFAVGRAPWKLIRSGETPTVSWTDDGIAITPVAFVLAGNSDQRIGIGGTWSRDGSGQLHVSAAHVFLETLQGAFEGPAPYGGVLDADGTISGTLSTPIVTGHISIENGRVQRLSYEKLDARVDFAQQLFRVAARVDQSAGAWLTASGSVPLSLLDRALPDRDIDLTVQSSPISLGLIQGLTTVVRNVSGEARLNVKVLGPSRNPLFEGTVSVADAAFLVSASGAQYKNIHGAFSLARDRVVVEQLHAEDNGGHPLDVRGSVGTRELKVGELVIDATARKFTVLRRELGDLSLDASLQVRGQLETPEIHGDVTVNGGTLRVDSILERTLFRPYSTEETRLPEVDALAALNPWERVSMNISLNVPENLRLTGENVQVSPGTPIGLGNINLRVGGDLYLYKESGKPLEITGSLDSIRGTYSFQGRTFEVDESSSINFRGDLKPELDVTVTRLISGVEARVSVTGSLDNPQLQLSSNPPLEPSEVLSLIVFNTSLYQLSATQQQELAVRAATLAAGFVAQPLVSALENSLGLETLGIEPSSDLLNTGPKVTVGEEIAPGLVARFSRQFGQDPYDLATIEYNLSRLFRIRASFSDAASLIAVSPFRRIERAGLDLLFFFSF